MTIRNITFAFLLLLLCPSTLFSQNDGNSQPRGSKENLKKGLARIKNYLDESPGKGIDESTKEPSFLKTLFTKDRL